MRASAAPATRQLALLRWYYAATPLFWVLDGAFGVSVRVAFLDGSPVLRHAYYVVCIGIGIVAATLPRHAGRLALIESVANIGLLILSVGVWYLGVIDWALEPATQVVVPGPGHVANFLIVATAAAVSYERQRWSA
jgi:hypothetical protein